MRYPARSRIWRRRKIMLLRQNFGGRHERDLVAVFNGDDRGLEGHNGFARSHVALQRRRMGRASAYRWRSLSALASARRWDETAVSS